jgi:DNA mismatch repair protein MutS
MCGCRIAPRSNYIARLIERGFKVAVCDQMEDPASAKAVGQARVWSRSPPA